MEVVTTEPAAFINDNSNNGTFGLAIAMMFFAGVCGLGLVLAHCHYCLTHNCPRERQNEVLPIAFMPPVASRIIWNNPECSICLQSITISFQLPCKHVFHKACIQLWLKEHNTCPLCRRDVLV